MIVIRCLSCRLHLGAHNPTNPSPAPFPFKAAREPRPIPLHSLLRARPCNSPPPSSPVNANNTALYEPRPHSHPYPTSSPPPVPRPDLHHHFHPPPTPSPQFHPPPPPAHPPLPPHPHRLRGSRHTSTRILTSLPSCAVTYAWYTVRGRPADQQQIDERHLGSIETHLLPAYLPTYLQCVSD